MTANLKEILGIIGTSLSLFIFIANILVIVALKIKKARKDKKSLGEALKELPDLINEAEKEYQTYSKAGNKKLNWVLNNFYNLGYNLKKLISKEEVKQQVEKYLSTPHKKD